MSVIKDILSMNDDYYELAKKILEEIGAIKSCDAHDGSFYDTGEYSYGPDSPDNEIYDLAFDKVKETPDLDNELFRKSIDKVMDDAQYGDDGCPICRKIDNE